MRTDGTIAHESPASTDNPLLVVLPASLPDGTYRLRTRSTNPNTTGAPGEPFTVWQSAAPTLALQNLLRVPVTSGTADAALLRVGYRYEPDSHGFFFMVRADVPVDVRMERIDGGPFSDSDWHPALPSSQFPDYDEFADFYYLRNYPPTSFGVGGVAPGRYRLSVRRQGDAGAVVWFDADLLGGRVILYQPMEPVAVISPVVTITSPATSTCMSSSDQSFPVVIKVTDGSPGAGNVFSVRLSDASGSFVNETVIGSGSASPIQATLPASLPFGTSYRIRVVASNPAVASAPGEPVSICADADLSMTMRVSNRTPAVGQPVTLMLMLMLMLINAGPQATSSVMAGSLLPDGLLFVDSASPAVSASPGSVTISAGVLATGESLSAAFRVRATRPGGFVTTAQITASSTTTDPDSQPNSGTGDGQDDAATADLRTADGMGALTVSPNPNQTPLPPVQSNQPPTNPATTDLSLTTDRPTPGQNEVVQLTLTVANRGGANASNVAIQTLLPAGWQLTEPNGLTVNGQTVTGTIASVSVGSSATLLLSVRVSGTETVQAQITDADPADPDSTPGNGHTNGEDDTARLDIRVR